MVMTLDLIRAVKGIHIWSALSDFSRRRGFDGPPPPGAKQKIDEKMFRLGGKFGPGLSLIPMYLYVIFGLRALLSISNKI